MKQIKILFLFFSFIVVNFQKNNTKSLVQKRKEAVQEKDLSSAIRYTKDVIVLKNKLRHSLSKEYYRLGYYFFLNNKQDSAYVNYKKSKEAYEKEGDSLNAGKVLKEIAVIESNYQLYYKSDSTAIKALKYLKNRDKIITSVYNCLGINANQQKEFKEAIYWYDLAIKYTKDEIKKSRYNSNKANNYIFLKDYEKAISIYKSITSTSLFNSLPLKLKSKVLDNYAYAKLRLGKDVDLEEFLIAQKIKNHIKDFDGLITNYSYLSDFYMIKDKKKSLNYAYKMYELAIQERKSESTIEALDRLIILESDHRIKKLAQKRFRLKDSIVGARKKSQNKLVKVIYNYDKEKKQRIVAEKKSIENKLEVEKQKSEKQIWLFAVIITILSSIVYFFYKREKNKKEKVIEVYKTETRLAKKIHDELANDVYLVMNKIQQGEDEEVLLNKLEKIYSQTRNISHENSPVLTGIQFEYFLKQLFTEFNSDICKVLNKGLSSIEINKLTKEKQIVIYRVLQELLVNMKKYSNASLVMITFKQEKDKLYIEYKDNGVGVDKLKIKNGLQNMETRIKSVGGTIIFESENQKGFQAKFQLKK
ncbi:hypothetical protein WH52_00300 [Tenacibaculum holothuriorum]|uniref:histidine kinase n=1 Tax=Tenacibaculum holothuriorum TaxID=1635173 RepID=A0A1Y2PF62_9FLAO|nr:ATP-binding protein [Tenacibaculum holothuriorum]OSY89134.1 hypothetical protein WH52_00300 [Tenacibaculum holothuriorum]